MSLFSVKFLLDICRHWVRKDLYRANLLWHGSSNARSHSKEHFLRQGRKTENLVLPGSPKRKFVKSLKIKDKQINHKFNNFTKNQPTNEKTHTTETFTLEKRGKWSNFIFLISWNFAGSSKEVDCVPRYTWNNHFPEHPRPLPRLGVPLCGTPLWDPSYWARGGSSCHPPSSSTGSRGFGVKPPCRWQRYPHPQGRCGLWEGCVALWTGWFGRWSLPRRTPRLESFQPYPVHRGLWRRELRYRWGQPSRFPCQGRPNCKWQYVFMWKKFNAYKSHEYMITLQSNVDVELKIFFRIFVLLSSRKPKGIDIRSIWKSRVSWIGL